MMALAPQAGVEARLDESRHIQATCSSLLFPLIEAVRRFQPFHRGVLTAIRPQSARAPLFELPAFSPFIVAARFADRSNDGDLNSPEILSVVHAVSGFQLNMLFVVHRQAALYRYGLVLESERTLDEGEVHGIFREALAQMPIHRLTLEEARSEEALRQTPRVEQGKPALVLEFHRTIVTERYVKLYFRNRYA